jgi:hypothetical protein
LNDPVYQEAAEALAKRMLNEKQGLDSQLLYGARLVLSRDPTERELGTLRSFYQKASEMPALRLASTATHDNARDLAAMTAVASVLLNLDAALTR